jgi:hypothetical protein
MTRYVSTSVLNDLVGTELDPSDWFEITQERVNDFADATNDQLWLGQTPFSEASASRPKNSCEANLARGYREKARAMAHKNELLR